MIEDGQGKMWLAIAIRLDQQITAPHPIARDRSRDSVLQLPPSLENPILVLAARVCDIGLAHPHLSPVLPPPIEMMRNRPTPRPRHEGF